MKQAESLIDELLDWSDNTAEPNLTQIEGVVLELRKRFSEEMAREVIEAQETKQPVPGPSCAKCGQEMRYKGQKKTEAQSWVGDLKIERGYPVLSVQDMCYHCPECQESLFPPR
jgi:hypothetical protein